MTKADGRRPFEYEYRPGDELVLRFRRPVIDLIPCEARDHLMAAQKEFLLALRSLVDARARRDVPPHRDQGGVRARARARRPSSSFSLVMLETARRNSPTDGLSCRSSVIFGPMGLLEAGVSA
jgi:hypothetical protein